MGGGIFFLTKEQKLLTATFLLLKGKKFFAPKESKKNFLPPLK